MSLGPLKIYSGSSHPELADKIAFELGTKVEPIKLKKFSDGSNHVVLAEQPEQLDYSAEFDAIEGIDAYVVQTYRTMKMNDDLIESFLMIHGLRLSGAKSIHAVVPYMPYSRGDKMSPGKREPISAQMLAILFEAVGVDRLMAINLHARQIQGFIRRPMRHLYATSLLVEDLMRQELKNPVLVAPDTGAAKATRYIAGLMGNIPIAMLNKQRPEDNKAEITDVVGDVKDKTCIMIDDLFDTCGTACEGRKALIEKGANPDIHLYGTHPVFSGDAASRLNNAGFKRIVVTDTLPIPDASKIDNLHVLSVAPLLADQIRRIRGGQDKRKTT